MSKTLLLTSAAIAILVIYPAQAIETSLELKLSADQDFERRTVSYDCGVEAPTVVIYLDAAPNFLAIIPIEGETQPLVFASVLPDAGARYASGQWIWQTRGTEARLNDITEGEDAEAVLTCSELNNTP